MSMTPTLLVIFTAVVAACAATEQKTYEGYTLVQTTPETREQLEMLQNMMLHNPELDFWTEPGRVGAPVDVLLPPRRARAALTKWEVAGLQVTVREDDFSTVIADELRHMVARKGSKNLNLDDWNDFATIEGWLSGLGATCADGVTCDLRSIGQSHEGRNLWVFSLSSGRADDGSLKPAFWIDATIHAREWLATGTILKILDNMVANGPEAQEMLDRYDFFFLPVMNPDGYDFSWTGDRLWRKNRAPNAGSPCLGADLNRNFNWRWGQEGVSNLPCSDLFCGATGGSELETQAVQAEAARLAGERKLPAWVTIHAYGRMWMHPWGNTINYAGQTCERAEDHDEMFRVADLTADAIQSVYGQRWDRGTSCEVIYATTGGTDDYVKGVHGTQHAICPELRGNSFIVANSQIEPSFREVFAGLVVMAREIVL